LAVAAPAVVTHHALVVASDTASGGRTSGSTLRVEDVVTVLQDTGFSTIRSTAGALPTSGRQWCVGVAVSFVHAGAVAALRDCSHSVWLDAVDSWILLNRSGVRAGRLSYGIRGIRDAARLALMPAADLVTWISEADLVTDGRTVRGSARLVLPPQIATSSPRRSHGAGGRAVLVGDWTYPPNRDGLRWFSEQVAPRLDATVDVFGSGLPSWRLSANLMTHGYVDDPRVLYREGDVHLAPVPYGAGVKRKVLQPLVAGLPVVTTPAGAHGLRPHPLLAVESDPAGFASSVAAALVGPPAKAPVRHGSVAAFVDRDDTDAVRDWLRAAAEKCRCR
jgi:hypothetical protein